MWHNCDEQYDKTVTRFEKMWQDVTKCGKMWQYVIKAVTRFEKMWQAVTQCGKMCVGMLCPLMKVSSLPRGGQSCPPAGSLRLNCTFAQICFVQFQRIHLTISTNTGFNFWLCNLLGVQTYAIQALTGWWWRIIRLAAGCSRLEGKSAAGPRSNVQTINTLQ